MSLSFHYNNLLFVYAAIKKFQFLQGAIGIFANTYLLLFHIFIFLEDSSPKATDLTICHLAIVHIMQLFVALSLSPELFELLSFQDNVKCKVLFYMSKVMRGLSISTTSLLSVLQAITISPSLASFAFFKLKPTSSMLQCFFFLWILTLCLSANVIFSTTASSNVTLSGIMKVNQYCAVHSVNFIFKNLIFTLTLSRDVSFVGTMLLSSMYMVILLFRHHRKSLYLHSINFTPRVSPEKRATQTILLLVTFFVITYWVDFLMSSYSGLFWTFDPVILCVQSLLVNIYATVSPLVLISSDKRILNTMQDMWSNYRIS